MQEQKNYGGMGFRDMVAFNKALLAKQIWRIIDKPNSLVAKVLKARYFKHNDIMDASTGVNSSFIWRSIMWSKDILKEGLCWRIGNGEKVSCRKDLWILEQPSGRITSNLNPNEEVKVSDLIQNHCWNEFKIKSLFLPYEVEVILKIPLPGRNDVPDARFWRFDKKGFYSVKSGYEIERKRKKETEADANKGSSSRNNKIWNRIWNLKVPPKVWIFTWNVLKEFIASEGNFADQHVPCNSRCNLCGFHIANTAHVLFFCSFSLMTWKNTQWGHIIKNLKGANITDIIEGLESKLNGAEFEEVCMKMWGIWKDRCNITHKLNAKTSQGTILAGWMAPFLKAFWDAQKHQHNHTASTRDRYTFVHF